MPLRLREEEQPVAVLPDVDAVGEQPWSSRAAIDQIRADLGVGAIVDEGEAEEGGNKGGSVSQSLGLGEVTAVVEEDDDQVAPEGYFERQDGAAKIASSFHELGLSRTLLRGVATCGWIKPTPVQGLAIPAALQGRDLCISAATGSGKTGAFLLPAIERLLLKPPGAAKATRLLVMCPTRELAAQCFAVLEKLAPSMSRVLLVGGTGLRQQEDSVRMGPDVVIGTPGRVVDLLLNAPEWGLEAIEMLVLDEADRLLDMGFSDQIAEVIRHCPRGRQTMLFSATMTENVNQLASLSLRRPVRVAVASKDRVVEGLRQEFVRVRSEHEGKAVAMAMHLLGGRLGVARGQVIVFVTRKKACHRLAVLLRIAGHSVAELHGNLNQSLRLRELEDFSTGRARVLVATDLASRGLDVPEVAAVLNVEMPLSTKDYIHRVGRTARAGKSGVAVSLVREGDRSLVKAIVKEGISDASRLKLNMERVKFWTERLALWEPSVKDFLEEEQVEREVESGLRETTRGVNLIEHADAIMARPRREWFQSEEEKRIQAEKAQKKVLKKAEKRLRKKEEEKDPKERLKKQKGEAWIPEEEMTVIRGKKRREVLKKEAKEKKTNEGGENLFHFRNEAEDEKYRLVQELKRAAPTTDAARGGAVRALTAQERRIRTQEKLANAHRHERKETHKQGFKSLAKYKRRRR